MQPSARRVALAALKAWRAKKHFADRIISRLLSEAALSTADRAFAIELFYGVLRNLTMLDFWMAALRPGRLSADLQDILRLGLYQLLVTETAQHAAVYETVSLAQKRLRPVVNGVLRNAARRREELKSALDSQSLEIRFSHPRFLVDRWTKHFGADATAALCGWNNRPPPIYARINQLKIDRQTFLKRQGEACSLSDSSNFVRLPSPQEALDRGDCYVQDPSTAVACQLLKPAPGEKVLDACAAPGGKTAYLAELMENSGLIVACDRDADRLRMLEQNLVRLDVRNTKVVRHDWTKRSVPEELSCAAPFDRILIDAPCSNTGVMRRRVDVRWRLKPADFTKMQQHQVAIFRAALPLLKRGGTLVYSTCSLEPEENEAVVEAVLRQSATLERETEQKCLPFVDHFDGAFAAKFRGTR